MRGSSNLQFRTLVSWMFGCLSSLLQVRYTSYFMIFYLSTESPLLEVE